MTEDNIVEVPFDKEHLLELILSPLNLNKAYKAVVGNKGYTNVSFPRRVTGSALKEDAMTPFEEHKRCRCRL